MPRYAAIADLVAAIPRGEQELIELTDRTGAGAVVESKVNDALDTGTSIADSYLGQVVSVPLTIVPKLVVTAVCDLARYQLYGDAPTEEVIRRRDQAIAWFKDVVAGRASLGLPPESPQQVAAHARRGEVRSGYDWGAYPS